MKLTWENLKAKGTKDHAEAKNTKTGNKPFWSGDYTDVGLDIIGGENLQALSGVQAVVGDGKPTILKEREAVPPNAEDTFSLDEPCY